MIGATSAARSANVNYRYTVEEVAYVVADSRARRCCPRAARHPRRGGRARRSRSTWCSSSTTTAAHPLPPGAVDFEAALAGAPIRPARSAPEPDDLYIVYTGGTTGRPKGCCGARPTSSPAPSGSPAPTRLHGGRRGADAARACRALPARPRSCTGAHWNALSAWPNGGTVCAAGPARLVDPHDLLDTIEAERCTSLNIVGDASHARSPTPRRPATRPVEPPPRRHRRRHPLAATKGALVSLVPGLRVVDIVGSSESGPPGHRRGAGRPRSDAPVGRRLDERGSRLPDPAHRPGGTVGWLAATEPIPTASAIPSRRPTAL